MEPTVADKAQHDVDLARLAMEKGRRGDPVSKRERAALNRIKAEQREKLVDEICLAFPKTKYRELVGRNAKQLHRLADTYGVPVRTSPIDLGNVLRFFHDLLDTHGHQLVGADAELMVGPSSPSLEKCRHEKFLLLRMERLTKEKKLLHTDVIRPALDLFASHLASMCAVCERLYGPGPAALWREALSEANDVCTAFFDSIDAEDAASTGDSNDDKIQAGNGSRKPTRTSASKPIRRQQRPAHGRRTTPRDNL
jgi:hypothetical protein